MASHGVARLAASPLALPLALLLVLAVSGQARPLLPIDETRYAAVAWEMWVRGDALVPHLNGQPYHHKPPLLFWLIHAGWAVFGVNEAWPRLISPLFTAATLALVSAIGRQLWPQRPSVAAMAPLLTIASVLCGYFASALMFDAMLACFTMLGLLGIVRAWRCPAGVGGFVLLAVGCAGALFAKGPVAVVHLLPPLLLAPWWMGDQRVSWRRWIAGSVLALLAAAAAILAWAVPAGIAGGQAYRDAIFWRQSAGRMVSSFAHAEPWWFHVASLPLTLAPWLPWPRWWRGLRRALAAETQDPGLRLVAGSALAALVFFSAISGKRWQYLLPEVGLAALLAARALSTLEGEAAPSRIRSTALPALCVAAGGLAAIGAAAWAARALDIGAAAGGLAAGGAVALVAGVLLVLAKPAGVLAETRRLAVAAVVSVAALLAGFAVAMREPYGLQPVAAQLAQFERDSRPVAINAPYHGQWTLAGGLRAPLAEVPGERIADWLAEHPRGRAVFLHRDERDIPAGTTIDSRRRWRGGWLAILRTSAAD